MKKNNLKILSVLVPAGIAITLLTLFALPLGLTAVFKISGLELTSSPSAMAFKLSACIYACAIPYVIALFKLKSICTLLSSENPFDLKISKAFNDISTCAFALLGIFLTTTLVSVFVLDLYLYAFTIISTIVVSFSCLAAGFLFKVVASVFEEAAQIKEDIDLTF